MRVKHIITKNPACCTLDTNLQEVARLMVEHDCGESPVVQSKQNMKLVGVITDRDITCRTVAVGKNPLEMTAGDCMSQPLHNCHAGDERGGLLPFDGREPGAACPGGGRKRRLLRHCGPGRHCSTRLEARNGQGREGGFAAKRFASIVAVAS